MCGIAGIVRLEGVSTLHLHKMSEVLKHRGPDDEGFLLLDEQYNIHNFKGNDTIAQLSALPHIQNTAHKIPHTRLGLLHRRLSILDLSPAGHQPMACPKSKNQLVFNGEIYNYKELRSELKNLGYVFTSDSDTEVVLAAYAEWGASCVAKFTGMWAIALLDMKKQTLFLSRDRFGIKPLYYVSTPGQFAFASEIKALLTSGFVEPEADMTPVLEYVCFGATADPSSNLFKQIKPLPPAHNLVINLSDVKPHVTCYYDLKKNIQAYTLPDENKIQSSFEALLDTSVNLHLRADVPVGSALSGGLDSSTLVAMVARKMQGKPFKTFTAAYTEKEIDESEYAKKVIAAQKNIDGYFTYPDANTYWQDIDKLIWHQDLPINSTSMFAQWEVMKLAGQHNIKVLLDGQGADEILGGYYNFAGLYLIEKLKSGKFLSFLNEKKELKNKFAPGINNALGRAAYYYLPEFVQRGIRAKKRLGMGFVAAEYQQQLNRIDVPARGGKTFREQSLLSTQFGLQDLLRYEDRNSMAFSIESRVPFLDHRLVEFSIALGNDWKIKNGRTKYILRKTAEPLLDKEVVWRKYKMGFLTPQKLWKLQSKKELDTFVNEVKMPAFLNKDYLLKLNNADINDSAHLSEFWKMVSFLKWAEIFNVRFK
jgi:asparagine synthase (glutamine-hydrolysing)